VAAITNDLELAHGELAPKYRTVAKWAVLFKDGRESLEDDPRSGRPITAHTRIQVQISSEYFRLLTIIPTVLSTIL
jgi:hypothetical protein